MAPMASMLPLCLAGVFLVLLTGAEAVVAPRLSYAQLYNRELAAAQAALLRTPGYTLFAKNLKSISTITNQYARAGRQPPVTAFAPNDAAVAKVLASIQPTRAAISRIVSFHILRAAIPFPRLAALRTGQPLATFLARQNLVKASPPGAKIIKLKSARTPIPATVNKIIYSGRFIVVYGIDKVLQS